MVRPEFSLFSAFVVYIYFDNISFNSLPRVNEINCHGFFLRFRRRFILFLVYLHRPRQLMFLCVGKRQSMEKSRYGSAPNVLQIKHTVIYAREMTTSFLVLAVPQVHWEGVYLSFVIKNGK